jgi:hypothetical protein
MLANTKLQQKKAEVKFFLWIISLGPIGSVTSLLLSECQEGNSIGADMQSMTFTILKSEA